MLMRKKWLMVVYCFLLSFMVVTVGIKSVAAKEKKAKFNKQYSGKVDGYHSTTYELKVPEDGTLYIDYSSTGDYTKVDTLSEYQGTGFFIPRIFSQNKTVRTKKKRVKKGDEISTMVYVQRPPMKGKYKIKFCYKKAVKNKKSNVKIYNATFSRVVKTSPRITSVRIAKGKCVIKGSFKLINNKGETVKRYASKKRSYKISKNFRVYMNDDTVNKIPKSEWNKQIKNIEKYGCLNLSIYKKGNELTKLVFTE